MPSSLSPISHSHLPSTCPSPRHKSSLENVSSRLRNSSDPATGSTAASAAASPHDLTADGLPGIPLPEAQQLNSSRLKQERRHQATGDDASSLGGQDTVTSTPLATKIRPNPSPVNAPRAPAYTHPPLPLYGPTALLGNYFFQVIASVLSTCFLLAVVCGAIMKYIPMGCKRLYVMYWKGVDPDRNRPFYKIELERASQRKKEEKLWEEEAELEGKCARSRAANNTKRRPSYTGRLHSDDEEENSQNEKAYHIDDNKSNAEPRILSLPKEGGRDKLVPDIGYYARRIGLDVEEYKIETEDGFLISLQRVFDPQDPPKDVSTVEDGYGSPIEWNKKGRRKYPVLLVHGLLQSSGAFCVNDDDSLAFFLCKSGYDVWLGNNRCGSQPEHTSLHYSDPRMWAWNIRHMGILDLPAFINHIIARTGFPKIALIAHSQGTAEVLVALAREQRPELGTKISVFCALAPAVYAGKLLEEFHFKFIEAISPRMFRMIFGIHAFIPLMMWCRKHVPSRLYCKLGYRVFSYLFKWGDLRWDSALRDRFFKFSPVYVSADSMRWWLGRECFATQRCIILATKVEEQAEDDRELRNEEKAADNRSNSNSSKHANSEGEEDNSNCRSPSQDETASESGTSSDDLQSTGSWYDSLFPPLALWVCGSDYLVDGKRFLKRLEKGREPHVRLVHRKIIEEYEHLDVLWAIDAVEQVGWEVRDVVWKVVEEEIEKAKGMQGLIEDGSDGVDEEKDEVERWWKDLVTPNGVRKGICSEEQDLS